MRSKYKPTAKKYAELLEDLEVLIKRSGYKEHVLAEKIGLSPKTFFNRKKKKNWTILEVLALLEFVDEKV